MSDKLRRIGELSRADDLNADDVNDVAAAVSVLLANPNEGLEGQTNSDLLKSAQAILVRAMDQGLPGALQQLIQMGVTPPAFKTLPEARQALNSLQTDGELALLSSYQPQYVKSMAWLESVAMRQDLPKNVRANAATFAAIGRAQYATMITCMRSAAFDASAVDKLRDDLLRRLFNQYMFRSYESNPMSLSELKQYTNPLRDTVASRCLPALEYLSECVGSIQMASRPVSDFVNYAACDGCRFNDIGSPDGTRWYPTYLNEPQFSKWVSIMYWTPSHPQVDSDHPWYILYGVANSRTRTITSGNSRSGSYAAPKGVAHNSVQGSMDVIYNIAKFSPSMSALDRMLPLMPFPEETATLADFVTHVKNCAQDLVSAEPTVDTPAGVLGQAMRLSEGFLRFQYLSTVLKTAAETLVGIYGEDINADAEIASIDAYGIELNPFPMGGSVYISTLKGTTPTLTRRERLRWLDSASTAIASMVTINRGPKTALEKMQVENAWFHLAKFPSIVKWFEDNSLISPLDNITYDGIYGLLKGAQPMAENAFKSLKRTKTVQKLANSPCEKMIKVSWPVRVFLVLVAMAGLAIFGLLLLDYGRPFFPKSDRTLRETSQQPGESQAST